MLIRKTTLLGLLVLTLACTQPLPEPPKPPTPSPASRQTRPVTAPKRIILMIGDGMGAAVVSGATYAHPGDTLEMLQMPHQTLMRTHEYEFVTTDSAASATALSTGHKTHYEGVSVTPGTTKTQEHDPARHLRTMVEAARARGWKTGLIATSRIVHATPAAFAAHRSYRSDYEDIALDFSSSGVDVLLGAGTRYFERRKDGANLLGKMAAQGYTVARTRAQVEAARKTATKLIGLVHEKDMPSLLKGGRAMSLPELVDTGLEVLDRDNPEGFFLMVEGSQIDWQEHSMSGPGAIQETLDFDAAVGVARRYASSRKDTLVVVTADHETGGLAIFDPQDLAPTIEKLGGAEALEAEVDSALPRRSFPRALESVGLATTRAHALSMTTNYGFLSIASRGAWTNPKKPFLAAHTPAMVPLFAQGQAARYVTQVHDNADLGARLHSLISAKTPAEEVVWKHATSRPKNLIVVVGAGAGASLLTAGYYGRGASAVLDAESMGFVSTVGPEHLVPDAYTSAMALMTGTSAPRGAVGGPETTSLWATARSRGMHIGAVSTSDLFHPTLAALYSPKTRTVDPDDLRDALLGLRPEVLFAGGSSLLTSAPKSKLEGVTLETQWSAAPREGNAPLWRLPAPGAFTPQRGKPAGQPSLEEMTSTALKSLQGAPEGFVLVVDASRLGRMLAELDTSDALLDEVADLDRAVAAALTFAKTQGETLVVVTADRDSSLSLLDNHYGFAKARCAIAKRCGGPREMPGLKVEISKLGRNEGLSNKTLQSTWGPPELLLQYAWLPRRARDQDPTLLAPATAHHVPVFAFGPGADAFAGFRSQRALGAALLEALPTP